MFRRYSPLVLLVGLSLWLWFLLICLPYVPLYVAQLITRQKPPRMLLWAHHVILGTLLPLPGWKIHWEGLEHVGEGPYVVVANHSSFLDVSTLMGLRLPLVSVAKPFLRRVPVLGWAMEVSGMVFLGGAAQEALGSCAAALKQGLSVLIFPEGTRSKDRTLGRLRGGAFRLASQTDTPLLPVIVVGNDRICPPGGLIPARIRPSVHVRVLPPIPPGPDDVLRDRAREVLSEGLASVLRAAAFEEQVAEAAGRYRRIGRWAEGFANGKMSRDPAYRAVLSHLPEEGVLLDVGCGEGYLLALAAAARPRLALVGLDHDTDRLGKARTALSGVAPLTLTDQDARDGLTDADAIACLDVLHYLPLPQQDALIAAMAESLRPGGVLLVREGEQGAGAGSAMLGLTERVSVALGRHRGDGVFFRSSQALTDAMTAVGLAVTAQPCRQGTPFANTLFIARKSAP